MSPLLLGLALAGGESEFAAANEALGRGDLAAAEAGYRSVLAAGGTGADVWFDLGNVLYRQDRVGEAILAWRNAQARSPRDPDVEANLDYARRKVRDALDPASPRPALAPWQAALTPDEGLWLGGLFGGLGLLLLAVRALGLSACWPHVPWVGLGAGAGLLGLLAGAGGLAAAGLPPVAVVLVPEVVATSDLGGGVDLFTLHEGAELTALEQAGAKVQVLLSDGRRGWLPAAAVGLVAPDLPPASRGGQPE